jgi:hypothetical protein
VIFNTVSVTAIDKTRIVKRIQCDQTFSAVITKRCAEILPNWIFFTKHVQIPRFEISGLRAVIVVTCYTLFGLFHGDSIIGRLL